MINVLTAYCKLTLQELLLIFNETESDENLTAIPMLTLSKLTLCGRVS